MCVFTPKKGVNSKDSNFHAHKQGELKITTAAVSLLTERVRHDQAEQPEADEKGGVGKISRMC